MNGSGPAPVMAEVLEEHEGTTGWIFRVAITRPDETTQEHEISMAWVDHDHWTGGLVPPSKLVRHLATIVANAKPDLPPRFDAARARRWMPDLDDRLMRLR